MAFLHLALPFLRHAARHHKNQSIIPLCFNPGLSASSLPKNDALWFTPKMPYEPRQADCILRDMKSLLNQDSSYFLHSFNPVGAASLMAENEEMAALADFTAGEAFKEKEARSANIRKHAQLLLLWRWAQEELREEILRLENRLMEQEAELRRILVPEIGIQSEAGFPERQESDSWLRILLSISHFLPEDAILWADASIREDLKSQLDFVRTDFLPRNHPLHGCSGILCASSSLGNLTQTGFRPPSSLNRNFANSYWWVIEDDDQIQ